VLLCFITYRNTNERIDIAVHFTETKLWLYVQQWGYKAACVPNKLTHTARSQAVRNAITNEDFLSHKKQSLYADWSVFVRFNTISLYWWDFRFSRRQAWPDKTAQHPRRQSSSIITLVFQLFSIWPASISVEKPGFKVVPKPGDSQLSPIGRRNE
jgi:hypothetical protein